MSIKWLISALLSLCLVSLSFCKTASADEYDDMRVNSCALIQQSIMEFTPSVEKAIEEAEFFAYFYAHPTDYVTTLTFEYYNNGNPIGLSDLYFWQPPDMWMNYEFQNLVYTTIYQKLNILYSLQVLEARWCL